MMLDRYDSKFGTMVIDDKEYFKIISRAEGNFGKLFHRLVYENFWGVELPSEIIIHHKDGNRRNNCILNLEAMTRAEHNTIHKKGVPFSETHKKKISDSKKGTHISNDTKLKISKYDNTTGIFRVSKVKNDGYTQGFAWLYQYFDENHKRRAISRVSLEELKKVVLERGLIWEEFN